MDSTLMSMLGISLAVILLVAWGAWPNKDSEEKKG